MTSPSWLSALKAGDVVGVQDSSRAMMESTSEATVKRITPSGRIVLEDGRTFNPDGTSRNGVTDHLVDWRQYRRWSLVWRFAHMLWGALPLAKLEAVARALEEEQ